ncbi:MAG: FAD-dependent oxidoreductase [Planctomycetes bacterium]|nr:FAD-dependent oxidoreductase [Planctomycetota bacterium]
MGQVRNPWHLRALSARAVNRGVTLLPGTEVLHLEQADDQVLAVHTTAGRVVGGSYVVTGGSWSTRFLEPLGCTARVRPLRGQIVLLSLVPTPIRQVVNVGPRYLVPRGDGKVLVGSTEEQAGFDKQTTASGVSGLMDFALSLVPALGQAEFTQCWAGLRPQSVDGLPYLGRAPRAANAFIATGHFRAGLQLSPITARLLSQQILGQPLTMPLEPFAPDRHQTPADFDKPWDV